MLNGDLQSVIDERSRVGLLAAQSNDPQGASVEALRC